MSSKEIECTKCGENGTVDFGGAAYATYTCGDCGTPNIVLK